MNITDAIAHIEDAVQDSRDGLPEEVFYMVSRLTPLVNVDLLIKNADNHTLLTWRADQFYGPGWHIPGGIIRFKETFASRIMAVAHHELGTTVTFDEIPLVVHQSMATNQDTRGHFISLLYRCTLAGPLDEHRQYHGDTPRPGQWAWHQGCPDDLIPLQRTLYLPYLRSEIP